MQENSEIQSAPLVSQDKFSVEATWQKIFADPDSVSMILAESHITSVESQALSELNTQENIYLHEYIESGQNLTTFIQTHYDSLRTNREDRESSCTSALALTTFAMRYVYGKEDHPFVVRNDQKLALLRELHQILDPNSPGAVMVLETGKGKSSVCIPALLPAALLVKPHWHVMNRLPDSRDAHALSFHKLGSVFNIQTTIFTQDASNTLIGGKFGFMNPLVQTINRELEEPGVVFFCKPDLGHYFERSLQNSYHYLPNSSQNGLLMDEIDSEFIESNIPMTIANEQIPLLDWLKTNWAPFIRSSDFYPGESKDLQSLRRLLHQKFPQEYNQSVEHIEKGNIECSLKLLQYIYHRIQTLETRERKNNITPEKSIYFNPDTSLNPKGWYEISRIMYAESTNQAYSNKTLTPPAWDTFFQTIIPEFVMDAVNSARATVRVNKECIYKEGKLIPIDTIGYPQPNREYEPIVNLSILAQQIIRTSNHTIRYPETVAINSDTMYQDELLAMMYSKIIGFTGSALEDETIHWFQKFHSLKIIYIPPEFENKLHKKDPYVVVHSETEKLHYIASWIDRHQLQPLGTTEKLNAPCIYNVHDLTSIETAVEFFQNHPATKHMQIQIISADNIHYIHAVIQNAGNFNTLTIAYKVFDREVNIELKKLSNDIKNIPILFDSEPALTEAETDQRAGRLGRNGEEGRYICFISPHDEIARISLDQQKNAKRLFNKKRISSKELSHFVQRGQKIHKGKLMESNEAHFYRIRPIVDIRKHLLHIQNETMKQKILYVWPEFLILMSTKYSAFMSGLEKNIPHSSQKAREYVYYCLHVYADVIEKASRPEINKELLEKWFLLKYNRFVEDPKQKLRYTERQIEDMTYRRHDKKID